jgi:hypothetical protein
LYKGVQVESHITVKPRSGDATQLQPHLGTLGHPELAPTNEKRRRGGHFMVTIKVAWRENGTVSKNRKSKEAGLRPHGVGMIASHDGPGRRKTRHTGVLPLDFSDEQNDESVLTHNCEHPTVAGRKHPPSQDFAVPPPLRMWEHAISVSNFPRPMSVACRSLLPSLAIR